MYFFVLVDLLPLSYKFTAFLTPLASHEKMGPSS